jgi:hypothetical protein
MTESPYQTLSESDTLSTVVGFFKIQLTRAYPSLHLLLQQLGVEGIATAWSSSFVTDHNTLTSKQKKRWDKAKFRYMFFLRTPNGQRQIKRKTPVVSYTIVKNPATGELMPLIIKVQYKGAKPAKHGIHTLWMEPLELDSPIHTYEYTTEQSLVLYPLEACFCWQCEEYCLQCVCDDAPIFCEACGRRKKENRGQPSRCPKCGSTRIRSPPATPYGVVALRPGSFPVDTEWKRRWNKQALPEQDPWELVKRGHRFLAYSVTQDVRRRGRRYLRMHKYSSEDKIGASYGPEHEYDMVDIVRAFTGHVWQCKRCKHVWQRYYDDRILAWGDY